MTPEPDERVADRPAPIGPPGLTTPLRPRAQLPSLPLPPTDSHTRWTNTRGPVSPALRVAFASRIDQVFFKLYAAADRREPRDFADLQQLEATAEELRAGARWARTHNMPGPFDDAIARALADLGVQDDGRDA